MFRGFASLSIISLLLVSWNLSYTDAVCKVIYFMIECEGAIDHVSGLSDQNNEMQLSIERYTGAFNKPVRDKLSGTALKSVTIANSKVTSVEPAFFDMFSKSGLQSLKVTKVVGSEVVSSKSLSGLEQTLTDLFVFNHAIGDPSVLAKLTGLTRLTLRNASLTELPLGFEVLFDKLTRLDLSINRLTTLPWKAMADAMALGKLVDVKLAGNKWSCDCSMKPIFELPYDKKSKIDITCDTPSDVNSKQFSTLKFEDVCTTPEEPTTIAPALRPSEEDPAPSGGQQGEGKTHDGSGVLSPSDGQQSTTDDQHSPSGGSEPQPRGGGEFEVVDPATQDGSEVTTTSASAGLSVPIIATIAAVSVVIVLIIMAIGCFMCRGKRRTRGVPSRHKSSKYCAQIEQGSSQPQLQPRTSAQYSRGYQQSNQPGGGHESYRPLAADDRL